MNQKVCCVVLCCVVLCCVVLCCVVLCCVVLCCVVLCCVVLCQPHSASILEVFTTCAQLARSVLTLSPSCAGVW